MRRPQLSSPPRPKPRLRGVLHLVGALATPFAAWALLATAAPTARASIIIYMIGVAITLGVSAAYHVPHWEPRPRALWRRADHAAILALIFGTYVPVCTLALDSPLARWLLLAIGTLSLIGAALELFRPPARAIRITLYIALGWAAVLLMPSMWSHLGATTFTLFCLGGLAYSIGALIYALKRPDPWPHLFGYHEVFHLLVILGCAAQYAAVWRIVTPSR